MELTRDDLKVGDYFLLGTYQEYSDQPLGATERLVVITALNPEDRGWYNDHQGGGWMSQGSLDFRFVNDDGDGDELWESTEYAADHWEKVEIPTD